MLSSGYGVIEPVPDLLGETTDLGDDGDGQRAPTDPNAIPRRVRRGDIGRPRQPPRRGPQRQ
eukprot:6133718-Pyramimonas_sp.AAC.1